MLTNFRKFQLEVNGITINGIKGGRGFPLLLLSLQAVEGGNDVAIEADGDPQLVGIGWNHRAAFGFTEVFIHGLFHQSNSRFLSQARSRGQIADKGWEGIGDRDGLCLLSQISQ